MAVFTPSRVVCIVLQSGVLGGLNLTGLDPAVWVMSWSATNPFYFISLTGPAPSFVLCPAGTAPYLDVWGASGTGAFGYAPTVAAWVPYDFMNGGVNLPGIQVCR
jgi:hypothetical protein